MQKSENRLKCHPLFLLFEVVESDLDFFDSISIVDNHQVEQQIFIYKNSDASKYEVRIYNLNSFDNCILADLNIYFYSCSATDEFASFYFKTFYSACLFIEKLAKAHPDSLIRPVLESK